MRTTVLLNPKTNAPTIARARNPQRKPAPSLSKGRRTRSLQLELVPSEQLIDRAVLHRAALPFLVTTLRRWQNENRIVVINGVLRVNPNYQSK